MESTEKKIEPANGLALTEAARAEAVKEIRQIRQKTRQQLEDEATLAMRQVTGALSHDTASRLTVQACHALVWPRVEEDAVIAAGVAAIAELAPQNGAEGMLSVQLIAVHNAALMFLHRATLEKQEPEAVDRNVIRASRLMRVFVEQVDALQKLKGKAGQQKVTVEHVHVHDGGQAIVGAVSATGGRGPEAMSDPILHNQRRGRLKNGNPPGRNFTMLPRCGAKAKSRGGAPCQRAAMANGRCRLHGGLSTGPKTPEGIERIRRAKTKHGRRSKRAKAERASYRDLLRACRELLTVLSCNRETVE